MPLSVDLLRIWDYDENRKLITATVKVTNENVEDLLEAATYLGYKHIVIFSGVHGQPGGQLQIDDEDFYKIDKELEQDGDSTPLDPKIEVKKMPLENIPPANLKADVADDNKLVILAWCYSKGYI